MQRRSSQLLIAGLLITILSCIPAFGQAAGGAIAGTVTDSTGAAVPNAKVVVHNAGTGVDTQLATNESGVYRAANLVPGNYHVSASAPGFASLIRRDVVLTVGAELT